MYGLGSLGACYQYCHTTASWCHGGQLEVPCPPEPAPAPAPTAAAAPTPPPPTAPAPIVSPTAPTPAPSPTPLVIQPLVYQGGRTFETALTAANGAALPVVVAAPMSS